MKSVLDPIIEALKNELIIIEKINYASRAMILKEEYYIAAVRVVENIGFIRHSNNNYKHSDGRILYLGNPNINKEFVIQLLQNAK